MNGEAPRRGGPLDDARWPSKLTARVVMPGPRPTVHGYDVEGDLARNYSMAESALLALTGEIPSTERARAFEIAIAFLSPAPVNEAPTHAAVVARICNVLTAAIVGTAAIALAEQARVTIDQHDAWLRALASDDVDDSEPSSGVPRPSDDDERRSVQRLREALHASGILVPALRCDVGRVAALLATLRFAGLTRAEQFEAVWVLARMPTAIAEAFATPSQGYREYPVLLPPVVYTEEP